MSRVVWQYDAEARLFRRMLDGAEDGQTMRRYGGGKWVWERSPGRFAVVTAATFDDALRIVEEAARGDRI